MIKRGEISVGTNYKILVHKKIKILKLSPEPMNATTEYKTYIIWKIIWTSIVFFKVFAVTKA